MNKALAPSLGLAAALLSSPALANWGWVTGTLTFESQQGNYCDSKLSMDCTHSRFPAGVAQGTQPVRDAEIALLSGGTNIGLGFTDRNGAFLVRRETRGATPASITIRWNLRHFEGRFAVVDERDVVWNGDFRNITPVHDQTVALTRPGYWGFTEVNNLYDGAQRTWWEALRYSNRLVSDFMDVRLQWSDAVDPTRPVNNAFASGPGNRIVFNGENARNPQGRVSHEMGHIASYLLKPFSTCTAYNYPTACNGSPRTACGSGWFLDGGEHHCAGFEEAMATFIGDVAYYWYSAVQPTTCIDAAPCATAFNLETSTGTSCSGDESRWPITIERYLWDVYDAVEDTTYADRVSHGYAAVIETLAAMESGTDEEQVDEPWNAAMTLIDDQDGRSALDFRRHLPSGSSSQYRENCSPGGD